LAIKIGHDVAPLDITKGVKIFIEGQTGKKVGYISSGVFTEITNTCADDSQTVGDALATGQSCKLESGSDLIIWTKHFSNFITYSLYCLQPILLPAVLQAAVLRLQRLVAAILSLMENLIFSKLGLIIELLLYFLLPHHSLTILFILLIPENLIHGSTERNLISNFLVA